MAVDETTYGNTKADELTESELEQYGVWVKSAPEDLDQDDDDSLQLEDFSVDELEDSARSFLGEEDVQTQQTPEFDEDTFDEIPVFSDEEEDLLAELEYSGSSATDSPMDADSPSEESLEYSGRKNYVLDIDDASTDSFEEHPNGNQVETEDESFADIEQEFNAVEPTESSLTLGGEFEVPGEQGEKSSSDYPNLEDYAGPDLESTSLPSDDDDTDDYDDIQIDLDHDSSIPELELDEETEHGVDDLTHDEEQLLHDAGDSVVATEKDDEMDQAAYKLLEQIQQEIVTIKEELHEVRDDIEDIRSSRDMLSSTNAETAQGPRKESSEEASGLLDPGFFEEDEDETIALTGDELDNILNTADFVEATGESSLVDEILNEPEPDSMSEGTGPTEDNNEISDVTFDTDLSQGAGDNELDDLDLESDFDISFEQETPNASEEPEDTTEELLQEDIISLDGEDNALELDDELDLEVEGEEDEDDEITVEIEDTDEPDTNEAETAELANLETDTEAPHEELEVDDDELSDDLDLGELESELDDLEGEDIPLPVDKTETGIDKTETDDLEPPIEEISLEDELDEITEGTESEEAPAGFPGDEEAGLEVEPAPVDPSELDSLAQLDIDSELADIDQLKDSPDDTFADTSEIDDISIAFPDEPNEETEEDDETELSSEANELELDELELEPDTLELDELDEELEPDSLELDEELDVADAEEDDDTQREAAPTSQSLTETMAAAQEAAENDTELSDDLREEIKAVLRYMDQLLESLPEDKIQEFASSEHFEVYKKLFEELGLET